MRLTEKRLIDALNSLLDVYIYGKCVDVARYRETVVDAVDGLANPEDKCTNCGERNSDSLVWKNEKIHCKECGEQYPLKMSL